MAPRRRKTDTNTFLISTLKAGVAIASSGTLAFIGSWGVGLTSTVAKLKEDVAVYHEQQEMYIPWFHDELKKLHEDLKEMKSDIKAISRGRK